MTTNHTTATAKLPIGTRIVFLKTLESPATGDAPAQMYAKQGEFGEVTGHDCAEGYWVKTDSWPHAFGAVAGDEFSPVESELTRLRAEIAELRAEREAMAKQEPVDTDAFLIFYDDKDRAPEVFVGDGAKDAALRRYDAISTSWNAHLFGKIDSNSRDAWGASPVPIPEGWQPIETAPKGETVLLYDRERDTITTGEVHHGGEAFWHSFPVGWQIKAVAWMPIPTAPKPEAP